MIILYYYDSQPYCRKCILEAEPNARFDDDDPAEWECDPEDEPIGKLYYQTRGTCQNVFNGGCLSDD